MCAPAEFEALPETNTEEIVQGFYETMITAEGCTMEAVAVYLMMSCLITC